MLYLALRGKFCLLKQENALQKRRLKRVIDTEVIRFFLLHNSEKVAPSQNKR